jgi:tetratricopeptide (TPR) repeat protein
VIVERPEIAESYAHAALALRQLERHAEAIQLLESGLAHVVARESHTRQLGMALTEAGQPARAVELLRRYATTGEPATLNVLAVALAGAGRHAEGLEVLLTAAARDPDDPKTMENQGVILLQMGRAGEARERLEQALRRNDALPISWNTLGVARFQLEGPASAIDAWRRAVALDPRQFDALFNLGLVAAKSGEPGEARAALRQFVASAPPGRFAGDLTKARAILAQLGG